MARRRKTIHDPRQGSLLFYVMAAEMEKKQAEQLEEGTEEKNDAGQADLSIGNSPKSPQAGNHPGNQKFGARQSSLFDFGQVGTEHTADTPGTGTEGNLRPETAPEPAEHDRTPDPDERFGMGSEPEGDVGLGDIAGGRNRNEPHDYRITAIDQLGTGGAKTKFADNVAAIRLLKQLQENGVEYATPEEQKILVRYVGWGGLPQAFDPQNTDWAKEYQELRNLLPPEKYAKARRSTQDAHYTSETVIKGIYEGLERLGVSQAQKLDILEPSAGIGNFIGLCPENLKANFLAVELDTVTAAINKYLYPSARQVNNGFQHVNIQGPTFDVAIGNPPFGNQSLFDPENPELRKFSIHNYFLAKSINLLKEGGIGAFVVSRYFLDSQDSKAREYIAENANFLGAIRLPETAFRQNALTDVTTDIVFFQKTAPKPKPTTTYDLDDVFDGNNWDWVYTGTTIVDDEKHGGQTEIACNKYFLEHPEQMIGKMVVSGGMFEGSANCVADQNIDLAEEIRKRLSVLPEMAFKPQDTPAPDTKEKSRNTDFINSQYFRELKFGALAVEPQSHKIVFKTGGSLGQADYEYLTVKNDGARQRLSAMIKVRDTLRTLLNMEKTDGDEQKMEQTRAMLNREYDSFVKKYGHLNSQTNRGLMRDDPEHSLLESLEMDYDKGLSPDLAKKQGRQPRPASAKKAAIFQKRVLKPAQIVTQVDNPKDALVATLRETGRVDFARMSTLLNATAEDIEKDLRGQGLIYLNPANSEWEISDKYLTGNVRAKLHEAKLSAATDPKFQANVDALTAAMPPEIEAVDIGIKFGSTWVPQEVFSDFVESLHGGRGHQDIVYLPTLGRWQAKVSIWDNAMANSVWGIPEYPAGKIIEALLTNKPIKVEVDSGYTDDNGRPIMVVDQELTAAAMQKADEIKQAFSDWVWQDDERRAMLTTLYNERFNTHVPPRYDGSHIELVGASSEVKLRPHQKDAVWRSIQEGTALFDHVVGAGKTMACIATIMESKRMGFVQKPMVVVPNHLLHQWRDEFYKLYPGANILVADKNDFTKANRERLFSRIATGEWDAVIVAHSSFRKIDMPRDVQEEILQEQINDVISAIRTTRENQGSRATIKQLEKQREKMETRFAELMAANGRKDRSVDFGDLGVDALFVDESHEFKNLSYTTSMNVSGLGNIMGSAKALDLFVKCRYLQRKHEGRGVYFLTGTPISNTIAEVYTLQRYLQYEEMKDKGIEHFDAWASTFGQITNSWELDATGVNYKLKSRFATFQNVPELLSMYRSFADVITKNDLDQQAKEAGLRPLTPPLKDGKPYNDVVERSQMQADYMESIIHRMEHLPSDPREDNPLKITNDARKAGLDFRLIDPNAEDVPGTKINAAVDRIHEIWEQTAQDKGTQLVFCDLSTPKGKSTATKDTPNYGMAAKETFESGSDDDDDGSDQTVANDMDAVLSLGSKFSVYDDMRQKLIAKGIPAEEIAFIHDANTDIRKAKLFSDMRAGAVRVLLGSTSKMGAGMNVQKRLVAAHHLDAPWRPSDLEQRNGRIIRQGNMFYERDPDNFSVQIYNYATKMTYDSRMWQTSGVSAKTIVSITTKNYRIIRPIVCNKIQGRPLAYPTFVGIKRGVEAA